MSKQKAAIKIMRLHDFITRYEEEDFDNLDYEEFDSFIGDIAVKLDEIMSVVAKIKEVAE